MAQSNSLLKQAIPEFDEHKDVAATGRSGSPAFKVTVFHDIDSAGPIWRTLQGDNAVSPGQNYHFIRLWIDAFKIAREDQYFVVAALDGAPVALLPLWRRSFGGIRALTWFPGAHVGCNAPLVDLPRLMALTPHDRRRLWSGIAAELTQVDAVYLRAVPDRIDGAIEPFAEFGVFEPVETLFRSEFSSWEEANVTQRSKSRRKHDRQQGDRLDALGTVGLEEVGNGTVAEQVLDVMFQQRAVRFKAMGVPDPFDCPLTRAFYDSTVQIGSGVPVRLHVLRLEGEIVAVRYSIALGDRLFCLISSMSEDPAIQGGSPGKQCLLRVMQTVFDTGVRAFDMGAGLTDEKRHWCNTQIALRQHYLPLNWRGRMACGAYRQWQRSRSAIKSNARLLALAKNLRGLANRSPKAEASE
ncbi:MAG TPA: GNAT family N-acetyltransferase [Devosiaceae bacterium]|jgi:CelD/BcsL family acetyltransferase involved in cellulose biosynthesis